MIINVISNLEKAPYIDYIIGDNVVSYDNPDKIIGKCTGFTDDNECIMINGKCYGGKYYFMRAAYEYDEIKLKDGKSKS